MILEIYTEKEVSKIDRERCYQGFTHNQFGTYTIIGPFYIVYKDILHSRVYKICEDILNVS